jgi:hypothetical protein
MGEKLSARSAVPGSVIAGTDIIYIIVGGTSYKMTVANFLANLPSNVDITGTLTSSGGLDITGASTFRENITIEEVSPGIKLQETDASDTSFTLQMIAGTLYLAHSNDGGSTVFPIKINKGVVADALEIGATGTMKVGGDILPSVDNTYDLGSGSFRMGVIYAGTGTINTSDKREKSNIRKLTKKEIEVGLKLDSMRRLFQWNNALEEKGKDEARLHCGFIAQEVIEVFKKSKLDPFKYSFICYDKLDAEIKEAWTEKVPVMEEIEIEKVSVEKVGKKFVQKIIKEKKEVQKTKKHKLYDENGNVIGEHKEPIFETIEHPKEVIREAGDRYGLRYQGLESFILAAKEAFNVAN